MARFRWPWSFWVALLTVVADRATKVAIEAHTSEHFHHVVFPGVLTLVHSHNPGIAFGLFADAQSKWFGALLIAASAGVIGLLAWVLVAGHAGNATGQAALALILGGAVGNLLDRLLYGSVTDFIEVRIGNYRWPAFNVADSAITVGAALMLLEMFLTRRRTSGRTVGPS